LEFCEFTEPEFCEAVDLPVDLPVNLPVDQLPCSDCLTWLPLPLPLHVEISFMGDIPWLPLPLPLDIEFLGFGRQSSLKVLKVPQLPWLPLPLPAVIEFLGLLNWVVIELGSDI